MDDGYAAGLLDGEGYIGIQEVGGYFQVRVKVHMTDKGLPSLRAMERSYGGKVAPDKEATHSTRATHCWRLNGRDALAFLVRVRPMLLVKAEAADIALQMQGMLDAAERRPNGQAAWTEEMVRQAQILRARIQEANRRGPDPEPPAVPPGRPLAIRRWGSWWEPDDDLFGPVEFRGGLPASGIMRRGRLYPQATWTDSASSSSPGLPELLPTPEASDGSGSRVSSEVGGRRPSGAKRAITLATKVAHELLPTPTRADGDRSHPDRRKELCAKRGGELDEVAVHLLPTPTAMDSAGSRNSTARRSETAKKVNIGDTLTDWAWKHEGWTGTETASDQVC